MTKTTVSARKPLTTLIIDEFEVPVNLAENFACGGVDGEFTIANIKLAVRGLTREGFVTEVNAFRDLVINAFGGRVDRYVTQSCDAPGDAMFKGSCEELAGAVVHLAHSAIGERLEKAEVEVMNLTGSVGIEWTKGDEVPSFLREASDQERRDTLGAREESHDQPSGYHTGSYSDGPGYDRFYGSSPRRNVC